MASDVPPHSQADSTTSASQDSLSQSQVLATVTSNLTQSLFKGRKRTRPQFRCVQDQNIDATEKTPETPISSPYHAYGRIFQRQYSSFMNIDNIVIDGIRHETTETDDDEPDTPAYKRSLQMWETLCSIIPNFREHMLALSGDRKMRKAVCGQINLGASAARCDDTAALKGNIVAYLLEDSVLSSKLGIERTGNKSGRGFNHPVTASLLCPIKHAPTQETYNKLKAGTIPYTASALPRFLFPQDQVYNADDIENGCFRGHLLLRVAKQILQGPSAALQVPGFHRGQQGVAAICNISTVTPALLAYLAIQTHFALSSASTWSKRVGQFDYDEFYWNLVDFLEGPEGEDTITLFNHHVFGQPAPPDSVSADNEDSDFDIIKLQRAAKRARMHGTFASGSSTAGVSTATGISASSGENPATAMAVGMATTVPVPGPGAPPATEAAAATAVQTPMAAEAVGV